MTSPIYCLQCAGVEGHTQVNLSGLSELVREEVGRILIAHYVICVISMSLLVSDNLIDEDCSVRIFHIVCPKLSARPWDMVIMYFMQLFILIPAMNIC